MKFNFLADKKDRETNMNVQTHKSLAVLRDVTEEACEPPSSLLFVDQPQHRPDYMGTSDYAGTSDYMGMSDYMGTSDYGSTSDYGGTPDYVATSDCAGT
jgi:hypothetical protein